MSGIPPCSGVKSGSATMAVRPFLMISSNVRVGFLKSAAVRALPTEMVAPAANVPSSRSSTMRLPPSSTTAMAPPGALSRRASPIAVATTCRAPSSVSAFFSATCASTAPVIATMSAATAKPMSFFMALPLYGLAAASRPRAAGAAGRRLIRDLCVGPTTGSSRSER